MNENIMVPPIPRLLHPLLADRNRGRGRPDSNNRKNSDKGVFVGFFATIFLKGRNINRGGGGRGCNFLLLLFFLFFFFFFWGGGGGGANPYFYGNLYNL